MLAERGSVRVTLVDVTGTATSTKPRQYFASDVGYSQTFTGHKIDKQADGTSIVRDVPVFKVGTFRDSMGEQHTWNKEQLDRMVQNFNLLKSNDTFPNVPVRADHSYSIDKVFGYLESVRADDAFMYADIHVTEPTALDKLARGTYRSRSLEVGTYADNNDFPYWPTVFGLAYVDIPAVEGLHGKASNEISYFSMIPDKENSVGTENTQPISGGLNLHLHTTAAPTASGTPAAPAADSTHGALAKPHTFRINDADEKDYAKVQQHIAILEGFRKTSIEIGRADFVKGLAKDGKIAAPQEAPLIAMVTDMDDTKYEQFKAVYEVAPKLSVFELHGNQSGNSEPTPGGEVDPKKDAIEIYESQLKDLRRSGMSEEKIKTSTPARKLAELKS